MFFCPYAKRFFMAAFALGVAASALLTYYFTSGTGSSDRRTSNQAGGPASPWRTAQTRTAANSNASGPLAPRRT